MRKILLRIARFFEEDAAQDLIEYSLLIAFVAIAAAGVLSQVGSGVQGPWGTANTTLATANGNPSTTTTTAPAQKDHHDGGHDGEGR